MLTSLAIRHLTSRKRQSALTLAGIVLGTAAYVTISGIMFGFQSFIREQLIDNDAHIRISSREEPIAEHSMDLFFYPESDHVFWRIPPSGRRDESFINHSQGWFEKLDQNPEVFAYSPQLNIQAIAKRGKISLGVRLIGSDPEKQVLVTNIQKYMIEGDFRTLGKTGNRMIAGDLVLERLGARVGETIFLNTGRETLTPFKIVGRFHIGIKSIDESTLFAALTAVQSANYTPSQISDIAVRLIVAERSRALADQWNEHAQDRVQSWDQINEGTLSVFKTQDIVRNSMTVSILIVAGFGIYNILNMAVTHKRKEIAILRSMGYESRDVIELFLVQGVILGFLGGIIGVVAGFFICKYVSTIEVSKDRMIGGNTMLVSFELLIYVKAFMIAFSSATLASFLPARAAGKLTPIDIIRSGD